VFGVKAKLSKELVMAKVWSTNKNKFLIVNGTLQPFKEGEKTIYDGCEVMIFHSGNKWWLHYAWDRCTGHFKSKKQAVAWYTGNGR
jgi:hypothetical protein